MKNVCGKRLYVLGVHPSWCVLEDNHEGTCSGPISGRPPARPDFMPRKK